MTAILLFFVGSHGPQYTNMVKRKINRELIHIVSRHSNWSPDEVEAAFDKYGIYAGPTLWQRFLYLLLPAAGAALTVSGIIFFFAYNWASMHKFFKLGLVGTGIIACVILSILPCIPELIRSISLAAAAILVGGLFAVFGQIYQTGSDSYDFFMGWSLFVAIWVLISGFPPLWLIGVALINTTVYLYFEQIVKGWDGQAFDILFVINLTALIAAEIRGADDPDLHAGWFVKTVALTAVFQITSAMVSGVFGHEDGAIAFVLGLPGLSLGLWYGMRTQSIFYISAVGFSAIVVVASMIAEALKSGDPIFMSLLVCVFVVGSTSLLIRTLIQLGKQWHGNTEPNGPDERGESVDTTES